MADPKMCRKIEVRDFREKAFFMVDDAYLNGYARVCGLSATGVYLSLCRHANKDQKAWPSIRRIASELAITSRTVITAIKRLEKQGIIVVERKKGKDGRREVNVYILQDKRLWIKPPSEAVSPGEPGESPGENNDIKPGEAGATEGYTLMKDTQQKDTHLQRSDAKSVADDGTGKIINSLIELFKPVNPSWIRLFSNKTQRTCLSRLIAQHGEENLRRLIGLLPEIVGKQYAPTITTPLQLEEKMGSLAVFIQRSNQFPKGAIQSL